MTTAGSSAKSSSFTAELITPGAIVVAESTWVSLIIDAFVNGSRGTHVTLPFLALALPALAALAVACASARLGRWRWRAAALVPAFVVGVALSAGLISELSRSGSFWPWDATGHAASVTAATAWFAAALAWGRGFWLGLRPPSFDHAAKSFLLGLVVFIVIIVGRLSAHSGGAFRSATDATGWLIFVWFPFAVAAVALVHERDLEQTLLRRPRSRPSAVWLSVLVVPMLAVALVGLLVAVTVGPLAPLVGKGVAKAGTAIWWVVKKLADLIPHSHSTQVSARRTPSSSPQLAHHHAVVDLQHKAGGVSSVVSIIIVLVLAAIAIALVLRYVRPLRIRRLRRAEELTEDDERDSVFSWRHFAGQLFGGLAGLFRRLRRQPPARQTVPEAGLVPRDRASVESIRRAYRRMLLAARASGQARAAAETTGEFEGRLADGPAAEASGALARLTSLYEAVRYGDLEFDEPTRADAVTQADAVSAAVAEATSPPAPPSGDLAR